MTSYFIGKRTGNRYPLIAESQDARPGKDSGELRIVAWIPKYQLVGLAAQALNAAQEEPWRNP